MAYDIQAAISGIPVKNGTAVVTTTFTGEYSTIDTYAKSTPTITDIQSKFDDRFDDPSYYYGIGNDLVIGG